MIDLFNLIFDNNIQTYFYIFAICYMLAVPFWVIWRKFFMHKHKKDCDK